MINNLFGILGRFVKRLCLVGITLLLVCHLFTPAAIASDASDIPDLVAGDQPWIMDLAGVLSSSTEGVITKKLEKLEADTGNQVKFLTVQRIDLGQPTDEFASELFDKWFKTAAEKANQVLIVMATEDHRTAIKVGERVKSSLPSDIAASIADQTILFPTQKSNYNQAVIDGANRLTAVLSGLPDPGAPVIPTSIESESTFTPAEKTDPVSSTLVVVGLLILATVIPMVTYFWLQRSS